MKIAATLKKYPSFTATVVLTCCAAATLAVYISLFDYRETTDLILNDPQWVSRLPQLMGFLMTGALFSLLIGIIRREGTQRLTKDPPKKDDVKQ